MPGKQEALCGGLQLTCTPDPHPRVAPMFPQMSSRGRIDPPHPHHSPLHPPHTDPHPLHPRVRTYVSADELQGQDGEGLLDGHPNLLNACGGGEGPGGCRSGVGWGGAQRDGRVPPSILCMLRPMLPPGALTQQQEGDQAADGGGGPVAAVPEGEGQQRQPDDHEAAGVPAGGGGRWGHVG